MTLYLKYRPQKIDELDLASVREELSAISRKKDKPHAYLFAGPRGAGKTSAARILAKSLNCENNGGLGEPCNECSACLAITKGQHVDVVEMDAASSRRIDDIRSLRESVALAPSLARKKVYIIDEVHMLTTEAANAFLKTLEEPPTHVVFVLATTDPEKLPETVRSRLTTISFRKATDEEIERQLKRVVAREKLVLGKDKEVISQIIESADGSFREAVKTLERLTMLGKDITPEKAKSLLSSVRSDFTEILLGEILSKNTESAIGTIEKVVAEGTPAHEVLEGLLRELHRKLLKGKLGQDELAFLELLLEAKNRQSRSGIAQLPLELAIVKWTSRGQKEEPKNGLQGGGSQAREARKEQPLKTQPQKALKEFDNTAWSRFLVAVRDYDTKTEALLKAATPLGMKGETLSVGVYYQFHKEKLENLKTSQALEEICAEVMGKPLKLNYSLTEKRPVKPSEDPPLDDATDSDILEAAKEIFG